MEKQQKIRAKSVCFVLMFVLFPVLVKAEKNTVFQTSPFLFYGSTGLGLAAPESDKVAGAVYQKKMRLPMTAAAGLGVSPFKPVWLGIRYEYWFASRETLSVGSVQKDVLKLQLLGPELGYIRGNSRVAYLFAAGAMFPIAQGISSSANGDYKTSTTEWNWQARAAIELRLARRIAVHFEGGYRWVNIKNLNSMGSSFIQNSNRLELSGPFVGMGLGLLF